MTIPLSAPLSAPRAPSAATLSLSLDRRQGEPLHAQLGRQLRELILTGRMTAAERLPSSRTLAAELGVSRATIVLAYEQLQSEGYLEGRHGAGVFVTALLPEQALQVPRVGRIQLPATRSSEVPNPASPRPFQLGSFDTALFPFQQWARLLYRSWRIPPSGLVTEVDPFGFLDLRRAIARHLIEWRGISCDASQIVVTSGTPDAIDLIAGAAFKAGDGVLVEEPGYSNLRHALARAGLAVVPTRVDEEGLDLASVAERRTARGVIVTSSRQFPLGVTLPLTRRLELLEWAAAGDRFIVEDDYDSEYRYAGAPLPALAGLDTRDRTIYIGSFSKVLWSSLRLGFLVLPPSLIAPARAFLRLRGLSASLVAQPALAELMTSGEYARHIRRSRRIYARRMEAVLGEQAALEGLLAMQSSTAGLHVIADLAPALRRRMTDRTASRLAAERGIIAPALADYYAGRPTRQALLLGFAGYGESELRRSVRRLAAALG